MQPSRYQSQELLPTPGPDLCDPGEVHSRGGLAEVDSQDMGHQVYPSLVAAASSHVPEVAWDSQELGHTQVAAEGPRDFGFPGLSNLLEEDLPLDPGAGLEDARLPKQARQVPVAFSQVEDLVL